jgi:hypothetical protein
MFAYVYSMFMFCVGSSLAGTTRTEAPTDYYYYKEVAVKRTNFRFTVVSNFT